MTDDGVKLEGPGAATSVTLLARVRAFEPAAWTRLVDLYGPLVYTWCSRAGLQPADAADVGQEVFAAVARAIVGFRRERAGDSFRGWLYAITRNKIRDLVTAPGSGAPGGSACRVLERVPTPEETEPPDEEKGSLVCRAAELVRRDFEPNTWAAFWQSAVEGRPADEVAAELGVTRNAVYLAKGRVRRRLLTEFAGLIDLPEPAPAVPADPHGDEE